MRVCARDRCWKVCKTTHGTRRASRNWQNKTLGSGRISRKQLIRVLSLHLDAGWIANLRTTSWRNRKIERALWQSTSIDVHSAFRLEHKLRPRGRQTEQMHPSVFAVRVRRGEVLLCQNELGDEWSCWIPKNDFEVWVEALCTCRPASQTLPSRCPCKADDTKSWPMNTPENQNQLSFSIICDTVTAQRRATREKDNVLPTTLAKRIDACCGGSKT